ncbi:hypothetical protein LZ31DRAFT_129194 [Colletotrichum somersetense]|nr:hypothetical protein LZ31DRAFT_129194 [Colletotrichum somersetense]
MIALRSPSTLNFLFYLRLLPFSLLLESSQSWYPFTRIPRGLVLAVNPFVYFSISVSTFHDGAAAAAAATHSRSKHHSAPASGLGANCRHLSIRTSSNQRGSHRVFLSLPL